MREGLQLVVTLLVLAWAYSVIAVVQLPNASEHDPDPYVGPVRHAATQD
jgi:hypothetical protein